MVNLKAKEIEDRVKLFFKLLKRRYYVTTSLGCRQVISRFLDWDSGAYQIGAELIEVIKESGLGYLGAGASRLVLSYEGYAIKIERWSDDEAIEQRSLPSENNAELRLYKSFRKDPNIRLLLIPIIHSFRCNNRIVLVFPEVQTYFDVDLDVVLTDSYNRKKDAVINCRFVDIQENNLGFYKGEIFYLDYNIESKDKHFDRETYKELVSCWKRSSTCIRRSLGYIKEMESM